MRFLLPLTRPSLRVDLGLTLEFGDLSFHPSDPELAGLMDDLAREMAQVGKCWKERTWRVVDMQAYVLRLYLEWARLFNED